MRYIVVNWRWHIFYSGDTFEECEEWMKSNPNPDLSSYTIIVQRSPYSNG